MEELKLFFNKTYSDITLENEKDHFQRYLTNSNVDLDKKSQIVQKSHLRGYGENLTAAKAYSFVKMGIFNK